MQCVSRTVDVSVVYVPHGLCCMYLSCLCLTVLSICCVCVSQTVLSV